MHHRHQNHTDVFVNGNFERSYTCTYLDPEQLRKMQLHAGPLMGGKMFYFLGSQGNITFSAR